MVIPGGIYHLWSNTVDIYGEVAFWVFPAVRGRSFGWWSTSMPWVSWFFSRQEMENVRFKSVVQWSMHAYNRWAHMWRIHFIKELTEVIGYGWSWSWCLLAAAGNSVRLCPNIGISSRLHECITTCVRWKGVEGIKCVVSFVVYVSKFEDQRLKNQEKPNDFT